MKNKALKILSDEQFLRQQSEEFDFDSSDCSFILGSLLSTIENSDTGAGLAAPQIGFLKKVFIAKLSDGLRYFINPKIEKLENPFINKNEGCLSFPGKWISTIRYEKVGVSYYDEFGKLHRDTIENFGAIIVQHEYDHLEGKLMFESSPPEKYDECFCGSGKKFKFCCYRLL